MIPRFFKRSRAPTRVLLSLLALLEVSPIKADGAVSKNGARRAIREARMGDTASYLISDASELKPSDLLPAFDLPPEAKAPEPVKKTPTAPQPTQQATVAPPATLVGPNFSPAELIPALQETPVPPAPSIQNLQPVSLPAQTQQATPTVQTLQQPGPAPQAVLETKRATGPQKFLINLTNVSVAEYIRFISRISGKNFLFNEDELNFNVTIVSEELTSLDEIMTVLMNELRIHGLSLIEQGNNIIIHNNPNVNSLSTILPRDGNEAVPPNVQIVTRVFRLSSMDPNKARDIIAPLLSQAAIIEAIPETGFFIVTDLTANIEKIADLLVLLDSPTAGIVVGQYKGQNLYVDSLAALAEKIVAPLAQEGKRIDFVPYRDTNTLFIISTPPLVDKAIAILKDIDGGGRGGAAAAGFTIGPNGERYFLGNRVAPDGTLLGPDGRPLLGPDGKPLNISSFGGALSAKGIAGALSNEGLPIGHLLSTDFEIYKLQYRKGDQIQQALQAIASSLLEIENNTSLAKEGAENIPRYALQTAQNELVAAISSTQWLETSNMLVFTGTKAALVKLKALVNELDIKNEQVLIELLLLDTTIADSLTYGVDFGSRFGSDNSAGAQGMNSLGTPLPATLNGQNFPNAGVLNANNLALATGFNLGVIGQNLIHCGTAYGSIGALVRAVHDLTDSKVVLNQKILVEDNQPAEIFVGLNVPFKTQSVANDFGSILTNNFEYRDIGATLKVTPFINKNGLITLQLEQELSTLIGSDVNLLSNNGFQNALGSGPTTRKSNTKTTIFVPNNFFVILSGNVQDETDLIRSNLPCLGGIPIVGALFSNKTNNDSKRALMMFIRPCLVNTKEEIHDQTKRQQDIYRQKTETRDMWEWEIDQALDFLNINEIKSP